MNKKGFTLIELLAVIVILGIISVIGVSVIYSYIQNTNKKTFTIEANNVISAAKKAVDLYEINSIKLPAGQVSDGNDIVPSRYCLTLSDLVEKGLWKKDASEVSENGDYEGKIIIVRPAKSKSYTYTLTMHDKNWKVSGSTSEVKEDNITKYDSETDDSKYTCGVNLSSLNLSYIKGLYRFQGTNSEVNNYICFGTTDKNTCVGNTDKYMYRIIGYDNERKMKIIKYSFLNGSYYTWGSGEWPDSSLYSGLNGDLFLNDTTYVPSPDTNGVDWKSKIATVDWHHWTGTSVDMTAASMADAELGATTEDANAKIGLMYIHDFYYSMPGTGGESGGLNCRGTNMHGANVDPVCKTSWMSLNPGSGIEWTISRYDNSQTWSLIYSAAAIITSWQYSMTHGKSVRPVFFLSSSEMIESGTGTITDPYILG